MTGRWGAAAAVQANVICQIFLCPFCNMFAVELRTVRSRLTPFLAEVSLGSCLLVDEVRNMDTADPSLLLVP